MVTGSTILFGLTFLLILYIAVSAFRNKVLREIGFRNIFRRKFTTLLVILGSMIGTALIAGSLTLGDSFNHSTRLQAENILGEIDAQVTVTKSNSLPRAFGSTDDPRSTTYSDKDFEKIKNNLDANHVDGVLPALVVSTSLVKGSDPTKDLSMTNVDIVAFKNRNFASENINFNIDDGKAVISQDVADRLDIKVGDKFTAYNSIKILNLVVQSINTQKGASSFTRGNGNILISEDYMRNQFGFASGSFNFLFVSAKGAAFEPTYDSGKFTDYLNEKLTNLEPQSGKWTVTEKKAASISGGNDFIVYLFLGVSIVGILAGILLIINIYSMLAEERKSEMGTLRAMALTRGNLIKTFVYEGFFYSAISSMVGVIAGVGVGYILLTFIKSLSESIVENTNFNISFFTQPSSWITSFCLGLLITFGTSYFASRRISRINIVSAIRNLPDEKDLKRSFRTHVFLFLQILILVNSIASIIGGIVILNAKNKVAAGDFINIDALGAYLVFVGIVVSSYILSILIGKFLTARSKEKYKGIIITAFNIPPLLISIFIGNIELFAKVFQSIFGYTLLLMAGLTIIVTATTIITYNIPVMLWILERTVGRISRINGIVKLSLRYTGENKFRTGLTILMFALVLFLVSFLSVVRVTVNQQIDKFTPKTGYDAFVLAPNYVDTNAVITDVKATGVTTEIALNKSIALKYIDITRQMLNTQPLYDDGKPTDVESSLIFGADKKFLDTNPLKLSNRWDKFSSDEEAFQAMLNQGNYVFLSPQAFGTKNYLNPPDSLKLGKIVNLNENGKIVSVIIAGYLEISSSQNFTVFQYGMIAGDKFFTETLGKSFVDANSQPNISFSLAKNNNSRAENLKVIQKALIKYNLASRLFSIASVFEIISSFLKGAIAILQAFLSFALFVGIAGISIIMVRSVNERKQQIGMLRSLGFQKSSILISFFLEASFIIFLGIAIGMFFGADMGNIFFSARNNAQSSAGVAVESRIQILIPYGELILIAIGTYIASIIFTLIPSYQASKLEPIEATNYLD